MLLKFSREGVEELEDFLNHGRGSDYGVRYTCMKFSLIREIYVTKDRLS